MDVFVASSDGSEGPTSRSLSSLCSLQELVKAGVTQHTDHLYSEAYNLTGWVLTDHANTMTSVDVVYDEADDLYFDAPTAESGYNDENDDDVKILRLGRVLVWFDFFVTSDTDRDSVEQAAMHMSEEEWGVVCGNTHARLVPTLIQRENVDQVIMKDSPNLNVTDSSAEVFTESVTHKDFRLLRSQGRSVALMVSPLLMCPFLTFPHQHYHIEKLSTSDKHFNTVNLTLMNVTKTVRASDIDTDTKGQLKMCASLFDEEFEDELRARGDSTFDPEREEMTSWTLFEYYVSLVCVCLSLLCLLMTLLTYTLFRTLRTIPGQNTMALCFNLFVAQALLQFGVDWTELRGGCIALGMLIHYFWLTSILWMNVCCFHMHRVFTAKCAARMSATHVRCCTRRVLAYAVYAQGVPLVIIGTTVSASIFLSEGHKVGYGGKVCYLSSAFLVGAAFVGPLGLVLVLNLVFFLRAAKAISRTEMPVDANCQNGHRNHSPSNNLTTSFSSTWRRNLNACIRLSSLTGLFWALGIIAELLDQRILRLMSVTVNGSQGVLIALSYLANRRVMHLYSQLCCKCRKQRPRSSTTVTGSLPSPNMAVTPSSPVNTSRNTNGHLHNSDVVAQH